MRTISAVIVVSLMLASPTLAQTKAPPSKGMVADQLGLTCAQILDMRSTDWISKFGKEKDASPQGTLHAIAAYGRCYDARTDRLVASLAKTRQGPSVAELKTFRDFDQTLKDFTSKTLASAEPPGDAARSAYAALYQKGFRYEFYQSHETEIAKTSAPSKDASRPAGAAPSTATSVTDKNDPFTKTKNHFGELLGLLPEDKRHEVHAAFGRIFAGNTFAEAKKLEIYRYAVFLLEPSSDRPFSPPPF
jgi:hypothetical protein